MLVDGTGVVAVYSHRVYGRGAGDSMAAWLESNGQRVEDALMGWTGAAVAVRAVVEGE
jgi:hypothetical protein